MLPKCLLALGRKLKMNIGHKGQTHVGICGKGCELWKTTGDALYFPLYMYNNVHYIFFLDNVRVGARTTYT